MRSVIAVIVCVWVSACTVGPDYVKPPVEVPGRWTIDAPTTQELSDTAWWRQFGDPVLEQLIRQAVQHNLDLKSAAARIDQYAGLLGISRAQLFPSVGGSATVSRERLDSVTVESAQAAVGASWEIDLWGRIRRANEAARARLLASAEARRAVLMSIVSQVAYGYITLLSLDRQLAIARLTEETYAKSRQLIGLRHDYGAVSGLALRQAESLHESAKLMVPNLESQIRQQENGLALLLGQLPGPIPRGASIDQLTVPPIPAGLPSTLLERRPDIAQAEQELTAANASIGEARAAYFPVISLTGLLGVVSPDLSDLFSDHQTQSALSGNLSVPLLNRGAIAGQVQQSEALHQQALYQYHKVVLNAFREVEDALVKTTKTREETSSRRKQVQALRDMARLANLQFDQGVIDFFQVLDAERSLFTAQLSLVQNGADALIALVGVYSAMGGGWITQAEQLADSVSVP